MRLKAAMAGAGILGSSPYECEAPMPEPIYDDDTPTGQGAPEEPSFAVWSLTGGALVLFYILVFVLLRQG